MHVRQRAGRKRRSWLCLSTCISHCHHYSFSSLVTYVILPHLFIFWSSDCRIDDNNYLNMTGHHLNIKRGFSRSCCFWVCWDIEEPCASCQGSHTRPGLCAAACCWSDYSFGWFTWEDRQADFFLQQMRNVTHSCSWGWPEGVNI